MAFHNVFLDSFDYGSAMGAGFPVIINETETGHEFRVRRQAQPRHRLALSRGLMDQSEAAALKAFALGRRGSEHSWGCKDWTDHTTNADGQTAPTASDQILGTGDGDNTTFQLIKTYDAAGDAPYVRTLTLPVSGSVVVAVDGTPTINFTVSGTGQVVLNTPPANGLVVTAGCRFRVPVRFEMGFGGWAALRAEAFGRWNAPDLSCIEVLDEVEQPERWFAGGGRHWGEIDADILLALNDGALQTMTPSVAINVWLPAPTLIPGGDRIFTISVDGAAAGSGQVRDDEGNAIGSPIAAGEVKFVALARSTSTATWELH